MDEIVLTRLLTDPTYFAYCFLAVSLFALHGRRGGNGKKRENGQKVGQGGNGERQTRERGHVQMAPTLNVLKFLHYRAMCVQKVVEIG